ENNDQEFSTSNNVQTQVPARDEGVTEKEDFVQEDKMSNHLFADQNSHLKKYGVEYPKKETMSLSDVAARVRAEARGDARIIADAPSPIANSILPSTDALEENAVMDKPLNEGLSPSSDLGMQAEESMYSPDLVDKCKGEEEALVSSDVGDQVASSFDQLVKALRESESRSLDQLSLDVLRPMLREWLDDNLPGIVERLVREEIERIARGPIRH
ncbi:hypothetical protein BWK56_04205, partial [Candidatus Liberibacter asiaticus]